MLYRLKGLKHNKCSEFYKTYDPKIPPDFLNKTKLRNTTTYHNKISYYVLSFSLNPDDMCFLSSLNPCSCS